MMLLESGADTLRLSVGPPQVVNLHYMLSKASVKARPNVLWCYKKDLYLSSHRKKRMKQACWAPLYDCVPPTRGCGGLAGRADALRPDPMHICTY